EGFGEVYELAAVRTVLFGPQFAHHVDVFAGALGAALKGDSQSAEFLLQPSDSDAQDQPPVAQAVDRGDGLGQHHRVVFGHDANSGAEADFAGARGDVGQGRERIGDFRIGRTWELTA